MPLSTIVERVRGLLRRIFFWLPAKGAKHDEQLPEHLHDHALVLAVVAPEHVPRWRQLRYIFRVFTPDERRVFLIASLVAVISLSVAGVTFAHSRIVSVPVVGGTYTEALVGEPKDINPIDALNNDVDRDLVRLIYSGLFRFDGLKAVPDLVENYSWSSDNKVLTLNLRKDARFHDGQPVTSEDVRTTIDNIQNPDRSSPLAPLFRGVVLAVPNESSVTFTLTQPDPTFLDKLTMGILPAHLWRDIPASNARLSDLNLKPVGSGPYRVKSFSRDGIGNIHSFTLEAFDGYYGDKPFLKTVVFQFFPDRQQALDAFKADLVDAVAFVGTSDIGKFSSSSRAQDIKLELPQETIAFLNIKNDLLASKDVRKALSLATNRAELVDALHGAAEPADGPYPFGPPPATSTPFDLDQARQILDSAGWILPTNGNVRIWSPPKAKPPVAPAKPPAKPPVAPAQTTSTPPTATTSSTELTITISVPGESDLIQISEVLKRQWSLLGVRVIIEPLATDELMRKATRERNLQVVLLNVLFGPDQDLFPFWWSGQAIDRGLNLSNVSDRNIDAALEATRSASTTEALTAAQTTASTAIETAVPAVFLIRPEQHYLVTSKINGAADKDIIVSLAERFQDLTHWYLKTGWRWK